MLYMIWAIPSFDQFCILLFSIRSLTFNPRAKLEVCTFTRSRDIRVSQNLKSRSSDLGGYLDTYC